MHPLVIALLAAILIGSIGTYACFVEPRRVSHTFLRVLLPGLRTTRRFLVIGDLHLRGGSDATFGRVRAATEWACRHGAETALLLGDLVERHDEIDAIGSRLSTVLRPLRQVYVSGNHELDRSGRVHWPLKRNDGALIRSALMAHGIECADDRVIDLGDLRLLGLPWQGWRVGPAPGTLSAMPALSGTTVLLTHSPDHVAGSIGAGVAFALCGHTHGGQVRVPLLGAPWTPALRPLPRSFGLMTIDGIPTYLTRGLSATFPVRFRAAPEVVLVEFGPASGSDPVATVGSVGR